MSHTVRDRQKLLDRIRRFRGQTEGIERMRAEEKGCGDVMHAIAGIRRAITCMMREVIDDQLRMHVAAAHLSQTEREEGAAELIDVLRMPVK